MGLPTIVRANQLSSNRHLRNRQGSVVIAAVLIIATLTGVTMASLMRSNTALKATKSLRGFATDEANIRSIVNLVSLKTKDYAWTPGQTLNDLLPNGNDRFQSWYNGTYNGISYTVSVADNTETEETTQDFKTDSDNKAYFKIAMDLDGVNREVQVLMSPGSPAAPGGEPAGDLPASIGICYGWLNFITLLSTGASDLISGFDITPDGAYSCPLDGNDCPGTNDQWGISTTSWLGVWELGSLFNWTSNDGTIEGLPPVDPSETMSLGQPTHDQCDSYDDIQTLADNMLASSDPKLNYYSRTWGTKKIYGNKTFGTESDPEVLYTKTGIFGKIEFKGTVTGHGILVADGNTEFEKDFNWNGVVINDANAIGNILEWEDTAVVYGATQINRPILSAEIGSFSFDLRMLGGNNKFQYSAEVVEGILSDLDPNYTPPAGGSEGQTVSISAIQNTI